jgi:hypothetical protein
MEFKSMGLVWAALHWFVHFYLVWLLSKLGLTHSQLLLACIFTLVPDLDHLQLARRNWREALRFDKPYRFALHSFYALSLSSFGAATCFLLGNAWLGITLFAFALHLWWDLAEDLVVFKLGSAHWK